MTAVAPSISLSSQEPARTVTVKNMSFHLHWDRDAGVGFDIPPDVGVPLRQMREYVNALDNFIKFDAEQFDLENQKSTVDLEDFGFVSVELETDSSEQVWVSNTANLPLGFGTPVLRWEMGRDFSSSRPCAQLRLDAVGLPPHANPLRLSAAWHDVDGLKSLLERAHAVDTYQVELALLDSETLRSSATRWAEDERGRSFAQGLSRSAHVKHSRIARILREQHASRHHGNVTGHLQAIDVPGSNVIPAIGLKRFDSTSIRRTLEEEGLVPLPYRGTGRFWENLVPNMWTFWVAEPDVFDIEDVHLVKWFDRILQSRCFGGMKQPRRYSL